MGFRFGALNLPDHLRHWHDLGLRTIYSEIPVAERMASACSAPASAPQGVRPTPEQPRQAPQRPVKRPSSAPERKVLQQAHRTTPKPDLLPEVPSVVTSGKVEWVEPWTTYLQRVPQPCETIWTYWELGGDLSFEPHQGRRNIFARLIQKLAWPKGSVGFFPVNEARNNKLLAKGGMFWAGAKKVQAKYVLSFGRRSLMTICPDRTFRYGSATLGGVRLFILPEMDDLVNEDRDAMYVVWNALKSIKVGG
ncbi:MAG: hypothetical protein ACNI3A_13515 [Desulfovibrio sp.]|uniref:hypothetical protein n=1 Tax=Desulfovibrio sp. 7SRBS1 TaxID=3378064 RepID=UPI003B401AB4